MARRRSCDFSRIEQAFTPRFSSFAHLLSPRPRAAAAAAAVDPAAAVAECTRPRRATSSIRCCCHGVHTATPCDSLPVSAPAVAECTRPRRATPSQLPQEYYPPCVQPRLYHRRVPTMVWYSTPPCCTGGGRRLMPTGLSLCLTFDAGLHLNQLIESKALLQYPRP